MFQTTWYIIKRDLVLAMRRKAEVLTTLFFFVIVVSLFPLGIGPEIKQLTAIGPGILWVAALLATMLSLSRLFADDFHDGTLEQLVLLPQPLSLLVSGKIVAHWVVSGLPLVILSPLLGSQLGLQGESVLILMMTLAIGTPILSLIGSIGAALTLGLRSSGVLVSILVLPLYVPVLIFGAGAVQASEQGLSFTGHFSLLGAMLAMAVILAPIASAAAVKVALE